MDAGISTDITDFDGNTPSEAACSCRDAPADCPKAEMQALMGNVSIPPAFIVSIPSSTSREVNCFCLAVQQNRQSRFTTTMTLLRVMESLMMEARTSRPTTENATPCVLRQVVSYLFK